MDIRSFRPADLHPTHGYSHAISVSGGRLVMLSGQVAFDKDRLLVGEGDFAAQARQAFENISVALAAAGTGFEGTDTAACLSEYAEVPIVAVRGSALNVKVTFPEDVALAERLFRRADA